MMQSKPARIQHHRRMLAAYGFGLFALPPYRECSRGSWRLIRHLPSLADGYVSPTVMEADRHVLYQGRTPWMSTGLMERESHAYHVHAARGAVVVAGLGLAMYAYAVAAKANVERVIVIEISEDVIELMRRAARWDYWPSSRKMLILQADARAPSTAAAVADALDGRRPDYLFADIWRRCDDLRAPAEMAAMVGMLNPALAGWWGQELAVARLARTRSPGAAGADAVTPAALDACFRELGVPVPVTPGYAAFCRDVMAMNEAGAPVGIGSPGLRRLWRGLTGRASER
ncbi:MAG: hypothetical protein JNM75_02460 [Rhodospirillales bacterium]|nr:hypothetical protein [Rhodospirillales bacterium]